MSRLDFLYRAELPHRAVSVYVYLKDRANKDGECWPAIPTIARELKLPVKFVGVGEGMDDLIPFDAKDFSEALFK